MPASRSSIGIRSQPWSLAYFSSAATPASNTSMPILTGTLPTVNQRLTARMAKSKTSGFVGVRGGGGGRDGGAGGDDATGPRVDGTPTAAGIGRGDPGCGVESASGCGRDIGAGAATGGGSTCPERASAAAGARRRRSETSASTTCSRRFTPASDTSATISSTGTASAASTTSTINDSIGSRPCAGRLPGIPADTLTALRPETRSPAYAGLLACHPERRRDLLPSASPIRGSADENRPLAFGSG